MWREIFMRKAFKKLLRLHAILIYLTFMNNRGIVLKAPSTRIRIRLYPQTFCCGYAYRPHVSGQNAHRNRKLLKTLSRVETFENATNPDTYGRTVTATI